MDLSQIPLFQMLRGRLSYLSDRQKLIAENVANADTPGYAPHDLKPFSFQAQMQAQGGVASTGGASAMAVTQPGHMLPSHSARRATTAKPVVTKDSETTLDGNSVVLEEEMLKMGDARMEYDAAIGFYQKSLNLIRLAARPPGHG